MNEVFLRIGPAAVLSMLTLWLVVATRRTSVRIEGRAYGFGAKSRQRLAQILFRGSVVLALVVTVAQAVGIDHTATRQIDLPLALRWFGLALAVAGAGLTVFAQSGMGRRWRVGIPEQAPDDLVTDGLFALSRNPVFFGHAGDGRRHRHGDALPAPHLVSRVLPDRMRNPGAGRGAIPRNRLR